jgi:hypothetical protein
MTVASTEERGATQEDPSWRERIEREGVVKAAVQVEEALRGLGAPVRSRDWPLHWA